MTFRYVRTVLLNRPEHTVSAGVYELEKDNDLDLLPTSNSTATGLAVPRLPHDLGAICDVVLDLHCRRRYGGRHLVDLRRR